MFSIVSHPRSPALRHYGPCKVSLGAERVRAASQPGVSGGAKEGRIVGRKALSHYLGSCHCRRHTNKTPHPVRPVTPFPALAADGFGDVRAGAAVGGSSYFRCLMDVNIGVPRPAPILLSS